MSDELSDFMESIGLDVKPTSPEKALMNKIDGGMGCKPIHNFRWWLRHEVIAWFDLVEQGMVPCRKVVNYANGDKYEPATQEEYITVKTKYYLRMHFHPWFDPTFNKGAGGMSGIGVANLDAATSLLLQHEIIKPFLTAKKGQVPTSFC